jgi:Domain of unknown function (DUF4440)
VRAGRVPATPHDPAEPSRAARGNRPGTPGGSPLVRARPLIAPDFQLINPGGGALGRDDYLGSIASGDIDYLAFAPTSPIVVRQSGAAAALRFQVHFDLVVGGTRLTHEGWITELYEHRNGRWQIVWEQATAVPNRFDEFVSSLAPPEPTS